MGLFHEPAAVKKINQRMMNKVGELALRFGITNADLKCDVTKHPHDFHPHECCLQLHQSCGEEDECFHTKMRGFH